MIRYAIFDQNIGDNLDYGGKITPLGFWGLNVNVCLRKSISQGSKPEPMTLEKSLTPKHCKYGVVVCVFNFS